MRVFFNTYLLPKLNPDNSDFFDFFELAVSGDERRVAQIRGRCYRGIG